MTDKLPQSAAEALLGWHDRLGEVIDNGWGPREAQEELRRVRDEMFALAARVREQPASDRPVARGLSSSIKMGELASAFEQPSPQPASESEERRLLRLAREALEPGTGLGPQHMNTLGGRAEWLDATRPLRAEIYALLAQPERAAEGWVLVPKEPTPEMCERGNAADYAASTHRPAALIYRAMLAASPTNEGERK